MDTNDHPAAHDPAQPLIEHLVSTAATLDIGAPAVDAVMARGRQRQQRTRTAIGTVSVLAVAGLSIAAISVLSRPAEHRLVGAASDSVPGDVSAVTEPSDTIDPIPAPDDTTLATTAGGTNTASSGSDGSLLVPSDFVWNVVEPGSAEAIATPDYGDGSRVVGDGPFLALSTAPGTRDVYEPVLWRSDDGLSWQEVTTPTGLADRAIAAGGGRFFTLGTTPAAADTGRRSDVSVSSSDDGGLTWSTNVLPLDTSVFVDQPGVTSVGVMTSAMAAGPEGVVVAAQAWPNIDFDSILPDDARLAGYQPTADGVQVYDTTPACDSPTVTTVVMGAGVTSDTAPSDTAPASTVPGDDPCMNGPAIDRTIPWGELGISQAVVDAMFSGGQHLFVSADGVVFDEVTVPTVEGETVSSIRLAHLDSGFTMMVATNEGGPNNGAMFDSTDGGRTWTPAGVAPLVWPWSFQGSGDRLVMLGAVPDGDQQQNAVAIRTAGTWAVTLLNDLTTPDDGVLTSLAAFNPVIGPTGITMSGALVVDPVAEMGGAEMTRDGVMLRAEDSSGHFRVLDDATGDELGTVEWGTATGAVTMSELDGSIDVLADDGTVRAHFTQEDLGSLTYGRGIVQIPIATLVLHSTDGVHWSRESLSDIAGVDVVSTGGIRINGSQIVVAANTSERNPDTSPHQVLLVGTPAT